MTDIEIKDFIKESESKAKEILKELYDPKKDVKMNFMFLCNVWVALKGEIMEYLTEILKDKSTPDDIKNILIYQFKRYEYEINSKSIID